MPATAGNPDAGHSHYPAMAGTPVRVVCLAPGSPTWRASGVTCPGFPVVTRPGQTPVLVSTALVGIPPGHRFPPYPFIVPLSGEISPRVWETWEARQNEWTPGKPPQGNHPCGWGLARRCGHPLAGTSQGPSISAWESEIRVFPRSKCLARVLFWPLHLRVFCLSGV